MDYLKHFTEADTDHDGLITRRQLFKYALKQNDVSMVDKWFRLFDSSDKGVISIDDVSRTLGVPIPQFYKERSRGKRSDSVDYSSLEASEPIQVEDSVAHQRQPAVERMTWQSEDEMQSANASLAEDTPSVALYDGEPEGSVLTQVTELGQAGVREKLKESELAAMIGKALDQSFGKYWHVSVSQKNIGSAFGHLPGKMVNMRIGGYFIIAYQTLDRTGG
ncbi:unnamed protein product [Calicophoron daubneyi]|uniref:EF-hand domain-containing protein n=1 Tax=Calicophoron daubneyi TaxID=300641 RepID=A0AAV2TM42_CALDB